MVRFSRIDPVVSGSNPPSAKLPVQGGESPALSDSMRRNYEVWSHRWEGPGHCSLCKTLLEMFFEKNN